LTASRSIESPDVKKQRIESRDGASDSFQNLPGRPLILCIPVRSADQRVIHVATSVAHRPSRSGCTGARTGLSTGPNILRPPRLGDGERVPQQGMSVQSARRTPPRPWPASRPKPTRRGGNIICVRIRPAYIELVERIVANLLRRWPDATADEISAAWWNQRMGYTARPPNDAVASA
jgi:hypothetical protein